MQTINSILLLYLTDIKLLCQITIKVSKCFQLLPLCAWWQRAQTSGLPNNFKQIQNLNPKGNIQISTTED